MIAHLASLYFFAEPQASNVQSRYSSKGDVSGSGDTKETVVRVVLYDGDGRGKAGPWIQEAGKDDSGRAIVGKRCPGRLCRTGFKRVIYRLLSCQSLNYYHPYIFRSRSLALAGQHFPDPTLAGRV